MESLTAGAVTPPVGLLAMMASRMVGLEFSRSFVMAHALHRRLIAAVEAVEDERRGNRTAKVYTDGHGRASTENGACCGG